MSISAFKASTSFSFFSSFLCTSSISVISAFLAGKECVQEQICLKKNLHFSPFLHASGCRDWHFLSQLEIVLFSTGLREFAEDSVIK